MLIFQKPWTTQPPPGTRLKQEFRVGLRFGAYAANGARNIATGQFATTAGGVIVASLNGLTWDTDSTNGAGIGVYPQINIGAGSNVTTLCVYGEDTTGANNGRVWESGSTFVINNIGALPWLRISGTNVLNPVSGATVTASRTRSTVARLASSSFADYWLDGVKAHTASHAVAMPAFSVTKYGSDANEEAGDIALLALWDRLLTDVEASRLTLEPWFMFEPRRIYIPTTAAAGGTPTLSDLQAASITATTVQGTYDYTFA